MKKIFVMMIILLSLVIPFGVNADTQTLDLIDTLKSEGIEPAFENYEETEEQVTIYLFRGDGCSHCRDFLEFLNSITEEYGSKFKLRSYEVYYNNDNKKLKEEVVNFFDIDASGVPFIVIGENTFYGFSSSSEDKIKSAIDSEFESDEKYDVFKAMEQKEAEKNPNDALFVIIPIVGIIIIAYIINKVKSVEEE